MNPRILTALVLFLGVIAAAFLGGMIGDGNMVLPAAIIGGSLFLLMLAASQWQPIPLGFFFIGLSGTLPALKNLTPFAVFVAIAFAWFICEYVVFRRSPARIKNLWLLWPLILVLLILAMHFVRTGGGMRLIGSASWGARNYFEVIIGVLFAIIVLQWRTDRKVLYLIPLFTLCAAFIDFAVWLVQYIVPRSIALIYPLYSAMVSSLDELGAAGGGNVGVERLVGLRTLGLGLILFCLATHNFKNLLAPKSILYGLVLIPMGAVLTALAGFRSYVAISLLMIALAGIIRLKWRAIFPAVVGIIGIAALVMGQGNLFELPLQAQRALSFLPGDWSSRATGDATDSTEWRQQVWSVWYAKYFPDNPMFGRGWNFDPREALGASLTGFTRITREDEYYMYATTGTLHNGPLSAIDAIGLVGFLLLVISSLLILWYSWSRARRIGFSKLDSIQRWTILSLSCWLVTFWVLDGFLNRFLPYFIVLFALTLRCFSEESKKPSPAINAPPSEDQKERLDEPFVGTSV